MGLVRLGRFAIVPVACLGLVGCPDMDDDEPDAPAELPDGVERTVGLVLAAPDLPPQFVCLGAFEADGGGNPTGEPVLAGGPFGIPDRTDPKGLKLTGGFPYGTVVRLPVRQRDRRFFDGLVPIGFVVDDVSPREFAGAGNDSEACRSAWAQARDVPSRQLPMAELDVGGSWLAGMSGCVECSEGDLQLARGELDLRAPASFEGTGDVSLTLQVANLATDESLQNVDLYLQAADGDPILLGEGLIRGESASQAVGVRLDSDTTAAARLLVVPHGEAPCISGDACETLAVPIQPSLERYASTTGAAWSGHQVLTLFGSAASAVRLGMFEASLP